MLVGASHAVHLLGYARPASGPSAVLLRPDGACELLVPAYEVAAAEEAGVEGVIGYGDGTMGHDLAPTRTLSEAAARAVNARRVGVAGPFADAIVAQAGAEAVPIDDLVAQVRAIKDDDEVERTARAQRLCLAAQDAVRAAAHTGAAEIELLTLAHATVQDGAGAPVQFGGDLLSGARSALVGGPVAVAGRARVADGDVVLADLYAEVDGYWGDTARATIVGERPEAEAVRDSIVELLDEVAAQLRPGLEPDRAYALVAEGIAARHPDGEFRHHAGHGLGLTPYEPPYLAPGVQEPLAPGMLVAVEPGVYFPGRFGVRHENVYLITEDGARDLTTTGPRDG